MLSKFNYVGMGIIVGFIATFYWLISNDNDTGYDTTFLLIKKDKYTFTDKSLQEDYKDWEEGYILTLKEDRAEIVEEISIFNMKNENGVEADKLPCKKINNFVTAYEDFYYHKAPEIIEKAFVDHCNDSQKNTKN